eukprot:745827-Hanusia_phi.AAC.2
MISKLSKRPRLAGKLNSVVNPYPEFADSFNSSLLESPRQWRVGRRETERQEGGTRAVSARRRRELRRRSGLRSSWDLGGRRGKQEEEPRQVSISWTSQCSNMEWLQKAGDLLDKLDRTGTSPRLCLCIVLPSCRFPIKPCFSSAEREKEWNDKEGPPPCHGSLTIPAASSSSARNAEGSIRAEQISGGILPACRGLYSLVTCILGGAASAASNECDEGVAEGEGWDGAQDQAASDLEQAEEIESLQSYIDKLRRGGLRGGHIVLI